MGYNKGFTLIEAVMVILIIAIIAVSGAYLMAYSVQNYVFIPNQLNTDMLASELLDIMIEGDSQAKGLRFCKSITSAGAAQVIFINQDNQTIRYTYNSGPGTVTRIIGAGPAAVIPYYGQAGVSVSPRSGSFFTYYDAAGAATSTASLVRRVQIELIAKTGTGSYSDWQGQSAQSSSVAVKKFI